MSPPGVSTLGATSQRKRNPGRGGINNLGTFAPGLAQGKSGGKDSKMVLLLISRWAGSWDCVQDHPVIEPARKSPNE